MLLNFSEVICLKEMYTSKREFFDDVIYIAMRVLGVPAVHRVGRSSARKYPRA